MKHKGFKNFITGTLLRLSNFHDMAKYDLNFREPCLECYTIYGPDKYDEFFRYIQYRDSRKTKSIKNSYYRRIAAERNFYNFNHTNQLSIREVADKGDI